MTKDIATVGYRSGLAAFAATLAFDVVQILQVAGVLRFPADEILIYGTSLCIVVPLVLQMLAFHHVTAPERRFWSHGALLFTVIYAVFVTANYVVQLATVIPAKLRGTVQAIRVLDQTPHSLFWNFDAVGYIALGVAALLAVPAVSGDGFARWVRRALLAHALVTPLIAVVYFAPEFSTGLLFLGFPWAVTAPLFMLMLALLLRKAPSPLLSQPAQCYPRRPAQIGATRMYGMPTDLDLSPVVGTTTTQLLVGQYDLQFTFGPARFAIQSRVTLYRDGRLLGRWEPGRWPDPGFYEIMNVDVRRCEVISKQVMEFEFENGITMHLEDTSEEYESMQIYIKGEPCVWII